MFHWRSWFLFVLCAHDISTDFSMHEKNKTESKHGKYIACMRDSSTARRQTDASPPSHSSPVFTVTAKPWNSFKGQRVHMLRVGVSRNFRACAYVRCAPAETYTQNYTV